MDPGERETHRSQSDREHKHMRLLACEERFVIWMHFSGDALMPSTSQIYSSNLLKYSGHSMCKLCKRKPLGLTWAECSANEGWWISVNRYLNCCRAADDKLMCWRRCSEGLGSVNRKLHHLIAFGCAASPPSSTWLSGWKTTPVNQRPGHCFPIYSVENMCDQRFFFLPVSWPQVNLSCLLISPSQKHLGNVSVQTLRNQTLTMNKSTQKADKYHIFF